MKYRIEHAGCLLAGLLLLVVAAGCASTAPEPTADLVIRDAEVFDSRARRVEPNRTVVVRDGLIAKVGEHKKVWGSDWSGPPLLSFEACS